MMIIACYEIILLLNEHIYFSAMAVYSGTDELLHDFKGIVKQLHMFLLGIFCQALAIMVRYN